MATTLNKPKKNDLIYIYDPITRLEALGRISSVKGEIVYIKFEDHRDAPEKVPVKCLDNLATKAQHLSFPKLTFIGALRRTFGVIFGMRDPREEEVPYLLVDALIYIDTNPETGLWELSLDCLAQARQSG